MILVHLIQDATLPSLLFAHKQEKSIWFVIVPARIIGPVRHRDVKPNYLTQKHVKTRPSAEQIWDFIVRLEAPIDVNVQQIRFGMRIFVVFCFNQLKQRFFCLHLKLFYIKEPKTGFWLSCQFSTCDDSVGLICNPTNLLCDCPTGQFYNGSHCRKLGFLLAEENHLFNLIRVK
jgi:hypothetical protein